MLQFQPDRDANCPARLARQLRALPDVALVTIGCTAIERRRAPVIRTTGNLQRSEERSRTFVQLQARIVGADVGQRGYVLACREPFEQAKNKVKAYTAGISDADSDRTLEALQWSALKMIALLRPRSSNWIFGVGLLRQSRGTGAIEQLLLKTNSVSTLWMRCGCR